MPARATLQGQRRALRGGAQGPVLHDPSKPLEILRTIHSFDPCLACAVHLVDPRGQELLRVQVMS